jgi:hypothetical protein
MGLSIGLELGRGADIERARYRQRLHQQIEVGDEREVLVDVVGQLVEHQRVDRQRIVIDEAERIAVGRRLRAGLRAGNAARAALFSITKDWPSRGASSFAVARMMTSVTLPAAMGTMTRIGRSG